MKTPDRKSSSTHHVFEIDRPSADEAVRRSMEMHQMMAKSFWSMMEKNLEMISEAMQGAMTSAPFKDTPCFAAYDKWIKEVRSAQDASLASMRELMDGYYKAMAECGGKSAGTGKK